MMKKLYEKSEITFAILWIVIYTVCIGNLRRLGDDSPVLMISLIVICALMFLCVRALGTMEYYGLTGWAGNSRALCGSLPASTCGTGYLPTIRCPDLPVRP